MTDSASFETRLVDALERYARRVPVDIEPIALTRAIVGDRPASDVRHGRLDVFGHQRAAPILVIVVLLVSIASAAILGGQILRPRPAVTVTPEPSTATPTVAASPSQAISSATPLPRPSAFAWTFPSVPGAEGLNRVQGLWRVGERFVGVASARPNEEGIDPHLTSFMRSDDGLTWETVPAPARGLEIDTGVVVDGVLWLVGSLGPQEDPRRGIWTTRDGETWERVRDATGLDFGMGQVTDLSHSSAGWLVLAQHSLDVESSIAEMYRSPDGIHWTKTAFPDMGMLPFPTGLVSDGDRWVVSLYLSPETGNEVWALSSVDGVAWTRTRVAVVERGTGLRANVVSRTAAYGSGGFVIVGELFLGEITQPVAWRSADGTTWTSAVMDGLPGTAGETGLQKVVATDGGYLAAGSFEDGPPRFWTSLDGLSWTQIDDMPGLPPVEVNALVVTDDRIVMGGQAPGGEASLWSAPR